MQNSETVIVSVEQRLDPHEESLDSVSPNRTFSELRKCMFAGTSDGLSPEVQDDPKTIVLIGGHRVKPTAQVVFHRFETDKDLHFLQRTTVRVEVFVSFQGTSQKPLFTVYWNRSKTIGQLRMELHKMLDGAECNTHPEVVMVDPCGRTLSDDESISCTITKSGEAADHGWVICQLLKRSGEQPLLEDFTEEPPSLSLSLWTTLSQNGLGDSLLQACKTLPYCKGPEGERNDHSSISGSEHNASDEDADSWYSEVEDNASDEEGRGARSVLFDAGAGPTGISARKLQRLFESVDAESMGKDLPADEGEHFQGPGGTQFPTYRRFVSALPKSSLKIPDCILNPHSLQTLRDTAFKTGLHPSSDWRNLPSLFHDELSKIIEGMNPLDNSLPNKLLECFSGMLDGVTALTGIEPFELCDHEEKLEMLNQQLEIHRKEMLHGPDSDQEDYGAELAEELQKFDQIFDTLAQKFKDAIEWKKLPEEVERDQNKFEQSTKKVQELQIDAKHKLEDELRKQRLTQSIQDEADKFRSKAEKQIVWSLELNLNARKAATNERDRIDDEIRKLKKQRRAANTLVKQHRQRGESIMDLARVSRLSYLQFCEQQRQMKEAIATRVSRAENQAKVLERSLHALRRLQQEYAKSVSSVRMAGDTQLLRTGLDAFNAYCGSRKFHFIDHCNARDKFESARKESVACEKQKKRQAILARRSRTDQKAKDDLENITCKFGELQRDEEERKEELATLQEQRKTYKQRVETILSTMMELGNCSQHFFENSDSDPRRDLLKRVHELAYPTVWEREFEQLSVESFNVADEEVERRNAEKHPGPILKLAIE